MNYLRNCKPNNFCQNKRLMSYLNDLEKSVVKKSGSIGGICTTGKAFGRVEATKEQELFYRKQREQMAKLKRELHNKIHFHEEKIKTHQMAISRNEKKVAEFEKKN